MHMHVYKMAFWPENKMLSRNVREDWILFFDVEFGVRLSLSVKRVNVELKVLSLKRYTIDSPLLLLRRLEG